MPTGSSAAAARGANADSSSTATVLSFRVIKVLFTKQEPACVQAGSVFFVSLEIRTL
jgi:hypothetical protein